MSDNTKSALRSVLETIHSEMADALLARVKEAAENPEKALTASEITAISRFLNDNDVKASEEEKKKLAGVADELPFSIPDELPSVHYSRG